MKKIATQCICMLLCIFLASCVAHEPEPQAEKEGPNVFNRESGTCISLGMTREEVESLLVPADGTGSVQDTEEYTTGYYGDIAEERLQVYYHNDIVIRLTVDHVESSSWQLKDGISLGSSKEEIIELYGESVRKSSGEEVFDYYYDANDTLLGDENGNAAYFVSFYFGEESLESYSIGVVDSDARIPLN